MSIESSSTSKVKRVSWAVKKQYFDKIGYKPHPGQELFHKSEARIRVPCCGTRWGKSLCAAKDVEPGLLLEDYRLWIVAPSYALGEKEFRYLHGDLVDKLKLPYVSCHYDTRGGNMDIKFKWGAEVVVKSCDNPESLLGEEVDAMILSEGSRIKRNVWERYLVGRMSSRGGIAIIPTTPAGYDDFLYPLFLAGQAGDKKDIESWEFPSSDNPHMDKDEIERARKLLAPEVFAEQYGGKFVSFSGRVYKDFDQRVNVIKPFDIPAMWERYRGLDVGGSNPVACAWIAFSPENDIYIYNEHKEAGKPISYHAGIMKDKSAGQRIEATYIDPSAETKADWLQNDIGIIDANNDVMAGVYRVMEFLKVDPETQKPRLFVFEHCRNTIDEFLKYSYPDKKGDMNTRENPAEKHNHLMDAIRYVIVTFPSFSGKYIPPQQTEGTFDWWLKRIKRESRSRQ